MSNPSPDPSTFKSFCSDNASSLVCLVLDNASSLICLVLDLQQISLSLLHQQDLGQQFLTDTLIYTLFGLLVLRLRSDLGHVLLLEVTRYGLHEGRVY